jgi:hypothetical protein
MTRTLAASRLAVPSAWVSAYRGSSGRSYSRKPAAQPFQTHILCSRGALAGPVEGLAR